MISKLEFIATSSDKYWTDLNFIRSLAKDQEIAGRKKRTIKTIAIYYWRLHDGGTERVTSRLVLLWRKMGYRVLLLSDGPPDKNDYACGDVADRFTLIPREMRYYNRCHLLAQILQHEHVDLFVTNLWFENVTIWDLFTAKALNIPVIAGYHNIFDAGLYSGQDIGLFRRRLAAFQYVDLVTVLSTMDQYWFSTQGIAARLVHNPQTFEEMPPSPAPLSSKTILFLGRLERHQKRVDQFIHFVPLLLRFAPDANVIVVGNGPDRALAEQLARALGVDHRIEFVGYKTDVAPYIHRAAVHVMTSEFEGAPMALAEVWAHGVPTVMFNLPYLEYLKSGKGYIGVEQLNLEALAIQVARVLNDDSLRLRLGAEARAVARSFFEFNLADEWRRIFDDLETRDAMSEALSAETVMRVAPMLASHLRDRIFEFDERHQPQPLATGRERRRQMLREFRRGLERRARTIFSWPERKIRKAVTGRRFAKLRSIDLHYAGLGDALMLFTGLYTLLENGAQLCEGGCVVHTPPELSRLASHLFTKFNLQIREGRPDTLARPSLSHLKARTWKQIYRAHLGDDWQLNWVEALDLQKTFPRPSPRETLTTKTSSFLSERFLYKRRSWREAEPAYIGYRVWLPVARRLGILPLQFMAQIKRSLPSIRKEFAAYVDRLDAPSLEEFDPSVEIAILPTGRSFQTIPPKYCRQIASADLTFRSKFFIQDNDPWFNQYVVEGITMNYLNSIDALLKLVRSAKVLLTTDSFSSHVAQLLRDDFVLVLSRDIREHVVHPAAEPRIVADHPGCAPCNYYERSGVNVCPAGYSNCLAFEGPDFIKLIVKALQAVEREVQSAQTPKGHAIPLNGPRSVDRARVELERNPS